MPQFQYKARSSEGKLVEASISARDRASAIQEIEAQKLFPIKVELQGGPAKQSVARPIQTGPIEKLPLTYQFLFTEQLAHLLSAGMTLDEALGILVRRLKQPKLQGLCKSLHQALIDGVSLSQAMRSFPKIFSPLYVNMVSAGEASGTLNEILRRLVVHLADVKSLRDRVQQALVYPAVLVVAGIGLILVFMTVMVPKMTEFFAEAGGRLPAATRILLAVNHVIVTYWWIAALIVGGAVFVKKLITRTPEGQRSWDAGLLRIPGYSRIIRYRYYAQFARTLGTLIENGVTLLKALELLEEISGNAHIRQKMTGVRKAVVDGTPLSVALQHDGIFPELFLDMMAVGEQTGRFGETMQMIADVYERELDKQVKFISALVPPVIMIFIAAIIGLVIFGIMSAVFSMSSGLQNRIH